MRNSRNLEAPTVMERVAVDQGSECRELGDEVHAVLVGEIPVLSLEA